MKRRHWGAALAAITLTLAAAASAEIIRAGKAAPAWTGKTLAGKTINSTSLKGKAVLLNFFSYS